MKITKNASKFLIVSALLTAFPFSASAKETEKLPIDYVALGDSLAAGITPTGENDLGYPEYLEARFEKSNYEVSLSNLGVPGYTSTDLLKKVLNDTGTQQLIKDSELITIDIGANDLLVALGSGKNPALEINKVYLNLTTILATIKQLNSNTEVYVMGYYNAFPYRSIEEQAFLLPLLNSLNDAIQLTSVASGYTFVPTEKVIAKNNEDYLPPDLKENIHLTLQGYQIIAKEFWKAIDND